MITRFNKEIDAMDNDDSAQKGKNEESDPRMPLSEEDNNQPQNPCTIQEQRFTPTTKSCSALAASAVALLKQRQLRLTARPLVYCQSTPENDYLCSRMEILRHKMRPSLWLGTSAMANSVGGFLRPPPMRNLKRRRFREIMTMGNDGAQVAIDWELPDDQGCQDSHLVSPIPTQHEVLRGPMVVGDRPVVLIVHGFFNDASFGYIRWFQRECTDRGWIAAGLNMRGCGGIPLRTPRDHTAAYTGDIRSVVRQISHRLTTSARIFLVGYSLGANLMVKYLGEEGFVDPKVAGAVSLGNPLKIDSGNMLPPWSYILGACMKVMALSHLREMRTFNSEDYQKSLSELLWKDNTVAQIDRRVIHLMPHNGVGENADGFAIGYKDGAEAYWKNSSAYKHVHNVSVPLLFIHAMDDFMVRHLNHQVEVCLHNCTINPRVLVVKTRTGGHLGWFHVNKNGHICCWTDKVACDFIQTVIEMTKLKGNLNDNANHDQNSQPWNSYSIKSRL